MMSGFSTSSFVAGIMVGALFVGAWFFDGNSVFLPGHSSLSLSVATSTESLIQNSGAISVIDQPAGTVVVVESVTVPPPGVWVAVREINGSALGNVLGAVRVSGPHSNISISLLRATEPGRPYAVELYRNDGADAFDLSALSVYVDFDTGQRVISYFKTAP